MSADTSPSDFFVAGGTLRPDSPSYVKRPADDELFHLASAGQFCYVLTARQMGKSSLMIRTARRLGENGVRTAVVDLTNIGIDITVEQWYLGLISRLKSQLRLSVDPEAWWAERASLGAVQRFTDFLHDVVLTEIKGPVVIFIDEIDTTLNLDFSDDFFAAIRACYNARATDPIYNRLTFTLLGVATPADLIQDRSWTPFNIGQGIGLREFSREDAQVLQGGLKAACLEGGEAIFDRIFYWTDGHPYLTQKLCLAVAEAGDRVWTNERVDELVERLFLSEEARKETNLQFVRDSVRTSARSRKLLTLYREVYEGKAVREDERSLDQNRLQLYGLVRVEKGVLKVRNEIYRRAFNLDWIKANIPVDWTRRIAVISTLLVALLAGVIGFSIYRQAQLTAEAKAQAFVDSFRGTTSAEVRITSLAGLFELPGYEDQARKLFYEELGPTEQLALFDLTDAGAVEAQLITVVKGVYTDLENNEQDNALLDAMTRPLQSLDDPMAINLANEIEQWLQGRAYHAQAEYQAAVTAYGVAISLNDRNPGTYFDRGLAYASLDKPSQALSDLELVLSLDEGWQERVQQVVISDAQLYTVLWSRRDAYRALVALAPTPTSTSTSAATPPPVPSTATPTSIPWTPTGTPIPTTPTPTNTPIPTTPMPTNTPRLLTPTKSNILSCRIPPLDEFTSLWEKNRDALGCPVDNGTIVSPACEEAFEGGHLFWRSDTERIYIVYDRDKTTGQELLSGDWFVGPIEWGWDGSNPNGIGLTPPPNRYEPIGGFGWLWREYLGREEGRLGWAIGKEYCFKRPAMAQLYQNGLIYRASDPKIYALLDNDKFIASR